MNTTEELKDIQRIGVDALKAEKTIKVPVIWLKILLDITEKIEQATKQGDDTDKTFQQMMLLGWAKSAKQILNK